MNNHTETFIAMARLAYGGGDPTWLWPDLTKARVGDVIYYCPPCQVQFNTTLKGACPSSRCDRGYSYRVWKVEVGEKERQGLKPRVAYTHLDEARS